MKFKDMTYQRPDVKEIEQQFKELIAGFNAAESADEQNEVIVNINKIRNEFNTQGQLVFVRHSIDTMDEFYKAEKDYMDEIEPVVQEYITEYYRALVNSKFRTELETKWGAQLLRLAELSLKTFKPEIIEDLQQENKLSTEYAALIASAKIHFEGEERTISQLLPFEQSTDRE